MTTEKERCGQWGKATKQLTAVVVDSKVGDFLIVPEKVVVKLCPKHFEIRRLRGEGHGKG